MANRTEQRTAMLFVLPAVVLVAVFRMFPLAWGFLLSFRTGDGAGGSTFVGLDNYRALTTYQAFLDSLVNTLVLLATLPIWVMLPMLLAILIHRGGAGRQDVSRGLLFPGGPGTATTLPAFVIWMEQGKMNRPGYASAISMVLFVGMAGLAWIQIRIMSRNV